MRTGEALQIGGGNIGRALVGHVMHEAGLHVTFADVNTELIQTLNNEGGYPIQVVSLDGSYEEYVDNISAVSSQDTAAMVDLIVRADIITTAVGAGILSRVAPTVAMGLMERLKLRPQDEVHVVVVACENMERNTETLRDLILEALPDDEWREKIAANVSFPNSAVDRIVPNTKSNLDHPLAVMTEDYFQLAIDSNALRSEMPTIPGIELVTDLEAILAQKLFTLNGAHAAAAYWGYLKGCETIHEAMTDPAIQSLVKGLMQEVSECIITQYPSISPQQQAAFADKIIRRFMNPYLKDAPTRVGREPIRKLNRTDRLLRPALLATEKGVVPPNLSMAIVGGFRFNNPVDPQALELSQRIETEGIDAAVTSVTGLTQEHPLVRQTVAGFHLSSL